MKLSQAVEEDNTMGTCNHSILTYVKTVALGIKDKCFLLCDQQCAVDLTVWVN